MIREYGINLSEFFRKLIQQDEIKTIVKEIRLAETIAVASISSTKEGNKQYNEWQREKRIALKDKQEEDTITIFERLRKSKKTNTIFDRFRFLRGR